VAAGFAEHGRSLFGPSVINGYAPFGTKPGFIGMILSVTLNMFATLAIFHQTWSAVVADTRHFPGITEHVIPQGSS